MKEIDILIVVDAMGALSSNDLGSNVYLIDTNKYFGSGGEGQEELQTACKNGQVINWRVSSISPSNDVEITGFTGQIIDQKICQPVQQGINQDIYWVGEVQTQGSTGNYQYSVTLTLDGRQMQFDPFLKVSA
jgi:hypothetical protein